MMIPRILLILLIFLNLGCNNNTNKEEILTIEQFYNLNKDVKLNSFKNWYVWPRSEGKARCEYVLDYMPDTGGHLRFFVFKNEEDELLCRQIFSKNTNIYKLRDPYISVNMKEVLLLYSILNTLNATSIEYLSKYDLYSIEIEGYSIIYSDSSIDNLEAITSFINYTKLDNHWFYWVK